MSGFVIIDGHHLMYRAYWAIPRTLTTRAGEQSNAVFGVASMLLTILQHEQPDYLVVCFDAGEETFRHVEVATYKEGRAPTPDDFYTQIPRILELVEAFGFKHISHKNYEADDFLALFAAAGSAAGVPVTIVTGDRDALQLATDTVRIAIPHKGYQATEYLGPKEILAKYGVRPDQVPSYKGLCGDASDNLQGVRGIGPKTAAKLLQQHDSLQGIYDHLAEIPAAARSKLEADREQAFLCERIATLVTDMPPPFTLEDLKLHDLSAMSLRAFFRTMEFTLLERRLNTLLATEYGKSHFLQDGSSADNERTLARMTVDQLPLFDS